MKYYSYGVAIVLSWVWLMVAPVMASDLMKTLFQPSHTHQHVVNLGDTSTSAGQAVLDGGGLEIDLTANKDNRIVRKDALIVRITKTLLRLTIALSVPALIYVGVKLIKSALNGGSVSDAVKEVSNVLLGLALAMSSVAIIYIVQSIITKSFAF